MPGPLEHTAGDRMECASRVHATRGEERERDRETERQVSEGRGKDCKGRRRRLVRRALCSVLADTYTSRCCLSRSLHLTLRLATYRHTRRLMLDAACPHNTQAGDHALAVSRLAFLLPSPFAAREPLALSSVNKHLSSSVYPFCPYQPVSSHTHTGSETEERARGGRTADALCCCIAAAALAASASRVGKNERKRNSRNTQTHS